MTPLWNTVPSQHRFASQPMESNASADTRHEESAGTEDTQPSLAIAGIVIAATILMFFLALYVLRVP